MLGMSGSTTLYSGGTFSIADNVGYPSFSSFLNSADHFTSSTTSGIKCVISSKFLAIITSKFSVIVIFEVIDYLSYASKTY